MKIINGKQIAENLNLDLSNQIARFKQQSGKIPYLVVIIVGDNPASHVYVRKKKKKALEVGIKSLIVKLDKNIEEKNLLNTIHKYNFAFTVRKDLIFFFHLITTCKSNFFCIAYVC